MNPEKVKERVIYNIEFFEKNGYFPFEKKKITIKVNGEAYRKIQNEKNKSQKIEKLILKSR